MDKEIFDILKNIQSELKELKNGQYELKDGQHSLESKLDETYQIIKSLEHAAEVNKAEHDIMNLDVAHIKGDVEAIRKDLTNVEIITSSNWADIAKLKAVK